MAERETMLPALGPRLHALARRLGVAGFWRWWIAQLDDCVPAEPRAALARRRMRPVLTFTGSEAIFWQPAKSGPLRMVETQSIPLTGDAAAVAAAGRAAIGSLTRMVYGGAAAPNRVLISLAARDVLRRRVTLPAAAEENYRQALAYDLDRHTPFKAEELYFDAVIMDRDVKNGTITIDLAAARRAAVDPALRHAASWGAEVSAVVPEAPAEASSSRLNLLPDDAREDVSVWMRWQFWLPVGLLLLLTIAVVVIPLWQKRDYAIALGTLADQERSRAAVSETLRAELDTRVADYNAALDRKYAFPGALTVVDGVSKLMPDDTWLTQFEIKSVAKGKEMQRELLLRGESANAGRLVQLFEESDLFAQAAPRSQTTKIQPGTGEIFDLGAQLKPLPKPVAVVARVGEGVKQDVQPAAEGDAGPAQSPGSAMSSPPVAPGVTAAATAPVAAPVQASGVAAAGRTKDAPAEAMTAPTGGTGTAGSAQPVPGKPAPAKPAAQGGKP